MTARFRPPRPVGRDGIKNGCHIMAALVPAILDIMRADIERNPDSRVRGKVTYPRINDSKDRPLAS